MYDYLENVEDLQEYQKKIEEILLWVWYLKNMVLKKVVMINEFIATFFVRKY